MTQITCPSCGYKRTWKLRREKLKCKRCKKEFSRKTYPVSGFRITEQEWRNAISLFLRERTAGRVVEELHLSQKTAQKMTHHLRVCMSSHVPAIFVGPVEMDETYIGGQRKNKTLHIRRIKKKHGHGTEKLPVVGIFCRNSGQVIVRVEPRKLDVAFIFQLVEKHIVPQAQIFTDGFKMYRGLTRLGFRHAYVDHEGGEYVRGIIHTNNIEGFWGILKRKLGCIGGMRRERLHLFVGEIVWKYNHRHLTQKQKEQALFELVLRQ